MQDSLATLANGMPDATMKSHLEPATLHSKTVDAPKDAQPVTVTPVDRLTLQGSYPGDSRAEAQGATSPIRGNDSAPRDPQDNDGLGA